MPPRSAICGLVAGALALAGCATTSQPAEPTTPADTSAPPASTTPASTSPPATPVDAGALKHEAQRKCSESTPDELQSQYHAPTSNPVDIADAYARTFPPPERVPVAEGCYAALTQQLGTGGP
jgi:hypothetical protein